MPACPVPGKGVQSKRFQQALYLPAGLQSLSRCLIRADVPHLVLVDDESENLVLRLEYKWKE